MRVDADDLIGTKEATELLGYANSSSVARLVYERKLTPARKMPGANGAYFFVRAHVLDLAAARARWRNPNTSAVPADNSPPAA